ncbi:MAG: hypothetical protein QXT12_05410 [Nitrososphaerota archaeon]
MKRRVVEVLDIDGAGIYPTIKLLKKDFTVTYYSIGGEYRITRLAERCLSPAYVRLIADSINSNRLRQSNRYIDAGTTGTLLISYVAGLRNDLKDMDVLRLVQSVAKNFHRGGAIIVTGLTFPGFMDRLFKFVTREVDLDASSGGTLLYLPLPLLLDGRIPVGGRLTKGSAQIVRAIVDGKRIVFGLSLLEAEIASISLLIRKLSIEISTVESLLLTRRLSVSPKAVLKGLLGRGVRLSFIARRGHPVLKIIDSVESNFLMGKGIMRTLHRMSRMAEMDLINLLDGLRKGRERLRILVVGDGLKILSELSSRKFVIHQLQRSKPEVFEERIKTYAGKCDVVLLTTRNKYVANTVKSIMGKSVVVINLCDYVGVGE